MSPEPPANDGKKRRSRTGCLTCRSRHKRCPEDRSADYGDSCSRCFKGGWECQWPLPPSERVLKRFIGPRNPSTTASTTSKPPEPAEGPANLDALSNIAVHALPSGLPATLPRQLDPAAAFGFGLPTLPLPPPVNPLPSVPQLNYSPTSALYASLAPPPTTSAASLPNSLFPSTTLAPAATSAPTPHSNPFGDLDVLAPSHLSLKPGEDLLDFFNNFDAELGSWEAGTSGGNTASVGDTNSPSFAMSGSTMSGTVDVASSVEGYSPNQASLLAAAAAASGTGATGGPDPITVARARRMSVVPSPGESEKEARPRTASTGGAGADGRPGTAGGANDDDNDGWLDPVYDTFNGGFFRSLPKPVRDVICERVGRVVSSSELSRNAGMAMVMLYRLRTQLSEPDEGVDPTVVAEQQAKLLAQSNRFFQKALEHIQTPIPFEAKMVAVLDMQNYQYDQWGAAASNAIVLLGEYFVHEELGLQPLLDLANASVLLATFAWTDTIRCLCIPGRRTVFTFPSLPGDPSPDSPNTLITDVSSVASDLPAHLGLPVGLMLCIAATTNLAAEMDALPDEVIKVKADAIEKATRGWRPPPPDSHDLADGAAYVEKLSTVEMWRHAIVIFLYQVVHKHGSLSRTVSEARQQILTIGAGLLQKQVASAAAAASAPGSTAPGAAAASAAAAASLPFLAPHPAREKRDYLCPPADRAVPWYLAGTVAHSPPERALCKRGLELCGPLQGFRDCISALERIWEVVDERGWGVDWRQLLQAEKRFAGFL
ncbi:hypothetical protein JCM8097_005747 [Rhodosporidiobolus ruineniae]